MTTITFEGLEDSEAVLNFYNGGTGGNGSGPGPNVGVTFSGNALALIDADAGGSGNIGGEPSSSTVLFFLSGPAATMNVPAGFDTVSFGSVRAVGAVEPLDRVEQDLAEYAKLPEHLGDRVAGMAALPAMRVAIALDVAGRRRG